MHIAIGWPLNDPRNCIHLLLERTEDCVVRPVMDSSGLDLLYKEVEIRVCTVWNPAAFSTGKPPVPAAGTMPWLAGLGVQGDRPAVTWLNVREVLHRPRQRVTVFWGPDVAFSAPLIGKDGNPLECDPMGGPFIEEVSVEPIGEVKSAFVRCRIRFAYSDLGKVCLSNRWRASSFTDGTSMLERRVIEGRLKLRLDYLHTLTPRALADQFRMAIAVPRPSSMVRAHVNVVATERGDELQWIVEDVQQALHMGNTHAASVQWNATAGSECDITDTKSAASRSLASYALPYLLGPLTGTAWGVGMAFPSVRDTMVYGIPTSKAQATCKVTGVPFCDVAELAKIALNVCVDRFSTPEVWSNLKIVSLYVTQGAASGVAPTQPFVEVRCEFVILSLEALSLIIDPTAPLSLMNFSTAVVGSLKRDPAWGNPRLPYDKGMRGMYGPPLAFLASQILSQPDQPPLAYPDDTSFLVWPGKGGYPLTF